MSNAPEDPEIKVIVPEGLKELMSDITREVLRQQPKKIFDFIANYLSALLITREHGIVSVKILADLCDCKPTLSMHLIDIGLEGPVVREMADIIKHEIEDIEPVTGKEKIREASIMKKILMRFTLDEEQCAAVCQIVRNAHNEYWYRKKTLEQSIKTTPDEPWEIAAEHTLELYKKTRPTMSELERATIKIQAAYRAYHVRKELLNHLRDKSKIRPHVGLGPPLDIAESREMDLGPFINIKVAGVDEVETKITKHKPALRFGSPTDIDTERRPSTKKAIFKNIKDDYADDTEYMVGRSETESIDHGKQHRISFFEEPPVIIDDISITSRTSQESPKRKDATDNFSEMMKDRYIRIDEKSGPAPHSSAADSFIEVMEKPAKPEPENDDFFDSY